MECATGRGSALGVETGDANRQSMALGPEELAEVITAWPLLSADLRRAILAIVRSATLMTETSLAATE